MTRHLWSAKPRLQMIGHDTDGATFARKFSSLPSHLQLRLQLLNLKGQTPKRMPCALDAADLAWQPKPQPKPGSSNLHAAFVGFAEQIQQSAGHIIPSRRRRKSARS